ncbi:MAG TPA: cupin domain-containing protein [Vicinamibacterales bacterium]|jgi:quercetin dioxygenase-like cupin family protein|nr:hypothetical protein [Acidobacteriota bacterium]MDP7472271.1 cupin domain-containing protein [Vicinamibacterales bacterium]HJO37612.1 cupin domain-containing protein [Vicinamibacterales bacterium]|tara:strand:- start:533 stop:955 length:423 start_codon:yes stop_codon:yes gene_type:complete
MLRVAITLTALLLPTFAAAQAADRDDAYESATGTVLEMLLDEKNLSGSEVEVGILTFPAGSESAAHVHQSTEVFYVLEGQLEHIVNGQSYILDAGMLGWVRAPDRVTHKVSEDAGPTRVLVIWAPGGEAANITGNWTRRP